MKQHYDYPRKAQIAGMTQLVDLLQMLPVLLDFHVVIQLHQFKHKADKPFALLYETLNHG